MAPSEVTTVASDPVVLAVEQDNGSTTTKCGDGPSVDTTDNGPAPQEYSMSVSQGPKRRSRRPKSKRGIGKPTGFEDYYADGPMTPAEHEEIRQIYDPRIEEALARYQWKRRMENDRRAIFFKYLQYGGVDASQNHGTGVPPRELKQMSTDDARQARSQTMIPMERRSLEVNFEEVARGFWSSFYCNHYNPDNQESIKVATGTIRNFLTYLLYHDVCPEYRDDIHRARKICDLAFVELWKNVQLIQQGPGSFNLSCSMLFGGRYCGRDYDEHSLWVPAQVSPSGEITNEAAQKVVKFAIASQGTHEQATRFQQLATDVQLSARKIDDIDGFEIISVHKPEDTVRDFYHEFAPDLPVVGTIRAKSFINPAKPEIDMTSKERQEWRDGTGPYHEFDFYLEASLLQHCYPGQRITSNIWKINCGVYYFDEVISVYPSFHLVLANDLMLHWKTPRPTSKAPLQLVQNLGQRGSGHEEGEEEEERNELDMAAVVRAVNMTVQNDGEDKDADRVNTNAE
ncbi:hypothetical protein N7539_003788 [Penicillium diatomitis]|uniref:Argonaute complex, subunit Arb1 n=1 Tax=Penicillium diatomitis TaxID=2819901 RepID=A0A9W9XD82_9EURO|nr:uncharacterized protein N7539_003788 [Penicillium diatomitis]KAJ5488898.1 hypothetical protein N7539_003788 [Penicillium diatomitis]